jgi:hypothetical protein
MTEKEKEESIGQLAEMVAIILQTINLPLPVEKIVNSAGSINAALLEGRMEVFDDKIKLLKLLRGIRYLRETPADQLSYEFLEQKLVTE